MTKKQRVQVGMFGQVRVFGVENAEKFPGGSAGQKAFATIASALARVEAAGKAESTVREGGRALKAAARQATRLAIATVVRTARTIAEDAPGADSKFQPPVQLSDYAVLMTAKSFLDHLPEVKDVFVEHGLPETFLEDLQRTTDQFAEAISGRSARRTSRRDAQADLVAALKQGRIAVRRLDVIVPNVFGIGSPMVDKWKRARYVPSGGSSSATDAGAEATPGMPDVPTSAVSEQPSTVNASDGPLRRAS